MFNWLKVFKFLPLLNKLNDFLGGGAANFTFDVTVNGNPLELDITIKRKTK